MLILPYTMSGDGAIKKQIFSLFYKDGEAKLALHRQIRDSMMTGPTHTLL